MTSTYTQAQEAESRVEKAEEALRLLTAAGLDTSAVEAAIPALRDEATAKAESFKESTLRCKECGATLTILDHGLDLCRLHEPVNEYWEAKRNRGGTFTVANVVQKVLFETELIGQMSDGAWENTAPYDHWEPWAECRVTVDPEDIGRTFYARKTGYAFAKELIPYVGDRMLAYARLALVYGDGPDYRMLEHGFNGTAPKTKDSPKSDYYATVRAYLSRFDLAEVKRIIEDETVYTEKDLRRDLAAINKAMKVTK